MNGAGASLLRRFHVLPVGTLVTQKVGSKTLRVSRSTITIRAPKRRRR